MNLFWQSCSVIAFGTACWALGDFLRTRLFDKNIRMPAIARHTLAFAAGNVVFSYLMTALGFAGLYISGVLWILFLSGIGMSVGWLGLQIWKSSGGKTIKEKGWGRGEDPWVTVIFIFAVGLFLLPALLQAAAPPYLRDSLVYHLLCPKEYLKAGGLVAIEGNIFSAFPKGHEVLMTLLLSVAGDRAAQGFSILQQLSAIGGLYSLARFMASPWTSAICTLGFATVPPLFYFTGGGYVEPALLMVLGNSILALTLLFRSREDKSMIGEILPGAIGFIGFLAGWMTALKYNGLIYLGLIGLVLLWSQRKTSMKTFLRISGVFTLAVMPGLFWMIWNWMTLGNPVYPMAWFLFGGKSWDEARAIAMSLYFDIYGMGKNLSDYLVLPWRLAFSGEFDTIYFDGAIGPFLLLFLGAAAGSGYLLMRRRLTGGMTKEIGFMFVVSAAFFAFGTMQTRFWLPSQMLVCAFAAPAMEYLRGWTKSNPLIKKLLLLVFILSLAWNIWFFSKQFFRVGYYRPVLGLEEERSFLIRNVPGYPGIEFINKHLPENSKLLSVWTGAYGYYFDRSYFSDTFIEDATLKEYIRSSASGEELSSKLTHAGFTHLFINLSISENNMEQHEREIFNDFFKKEGRELFRYQNYRIVEIHRP